VVGPIAARWNVTVGSRYAEVENRLTETTAFPAGVVLKDDQLVGELGVVFQPAPGWRFFARRDGNFRFAKVDEQTFTSPGVIGLDTQTGASWELGAEWRTLTHSLRVTAYRLALSDEIGFDPAAPPASIFIPGANANFSDTVRDGVSIEAGWSLSSWLHFQGAYTFTDARFESGVFDGKQISGVSEHLLSINASVEMLGGLTSYLELQATGDQFLSGDNANALAKQSGFSVVNLGVNYAVGGLSVSAQVRNLFDKEYVEVANTGGIFPSPERNFLLSIGYAIP